MTVPGAGGMKMRGCWCAGLFPPRSCKSCCSCAGSILRDWLLFMFEDEMGLFMFMLLMLLFDDIKSEKFVRPTVTACIPRE